MNYRIRQVDPVLRRAFNEFCKEHLIYGTATELGNPLKGITAICKHFEISISELNAWRYLAFPIYRVKGIRQREKWYANPERVQMWFRWRDEVQSGLAPVDPAALDR